MTNRRVTGIALFIALCCIIAMIPVPTLALEQSVSNSLTRGSRFTVTITGLPNTAYYVWLPGTFTMTGEQYDRPPVIADTANVVKDPDDGPYTIGSYQYYNGGGRTILDDVAPSTDTVSCTNYYARVTTDSTGLAIVEFRTSVYTAIRSYSVSVENPQAPENTNLKVEQTVYSRSASRPLINTRSPTATVVITTAIPTPTPSPTPLPATVLPTTTASPLPSPVPTRTSPPGAGDAIIAAVVVGTCLAVREQRDP
ncbi:hypothetical protein [Methanoregula sp.]|uniref:hypothetical protein n=1 Tax=Methanoregula sp. TaxID=2052170 RepID=UPI00237214FE|nr:hypothetical protein [Methanoregula sp.]MDD1686651.1 hypothetical protein [Methanoregula sp.]